MELGEAVNVSLTSPLSEAGIPEANLEAYYE